MVTLEIKVNADERGLAKELDKTFWLVGLAYEPFVEFLRNHYDPFLALPRDPLGPVGSRLSEDFAEAGLRALNLPGFTGRFQADIQDAGSVDTRFLFCACHNSPNI
jgi:hypothetical protein